MITAADIDVTIPGEVASGDAAGHGRGRPPGDSGAAYG